jgi:hypothetical protein
VGSWIALGFAGVWSVGLLVAAVTLPAYSRSSVTYSSATGPVSVTESSATLVEENGSGVLAVVAIPLVVTGVVALALVFRFRTARSGPGVLACALCGVVLVLCLLSMLTIGLFVLPVAIALVAACALAS